MALIGLSGHKQVGKDLVCKIIQYLHYFNMKNLDYKDIADFLNDKNLSLELLADYTGWQRKLFADRLKDITCMLIGCTREQLEDNEFKETPLGEEWRVYSYIDYSVDYSIVLFDVPNYEKIADPTLYNSSRYSFHQTYILTPRKLLQLLGTECGRNIIHPNIWINALMSEYKITNTHWTNDDYPNWIITDCRFKNEVKAVEDRGGVVIRVERPTSVSKDLHESETALDNYKFKYTIINDDTIEALIEVTKNILIQLKIL